MYSSAEKLAAINVLLMAFGNCHTLQNSCASRFTQVFTLNFDSTGAIASASVQVAVFNITKQFFFLLYFNLANSNYQFLYIKA